MTDGNGPGLAHVTLRVDPAALPRVALRPDEAAAVLGISRDSFDRFVLPEIRVIRRGRLVLVPMRELEKWCEASASLTLETDRR